MKNRNRYFIDLFAGCGGLSLGLENAGFTPLLVNELSNEARRSYLVNRHEYSHLQKTGINNPQKPWVWKDVKELCHYVAHEYTLFRSLVRNEFQLDIGAGELDLIVGGPPCQGYSGIGHRRNYSVPKKDIKSNHLYEDMLFLIAKLQPKIFLFENVRGLLSARWDEGHEKGSIWRDIRSSYKKTLGSQYTIGWHLVRAAEYGVPQNRPRVLMAGIRKDLKWVPESNQLDQEGLLLNDRIVRAGGLIPPPTYAPPSLLDLLGDLEDPNYTPGLKETTVYPKPVSRKKNSVQALLRHSKNSRLPLPKGAPVSEHEYSRHSSHVVEKFNFMIQNKGAIQERHKTKKFAQRVLPKEWENGVPTITATSLPDDYVHYSQPRVPTVREWARMQFFPDWYEFEGKRTTGGLRRAGNPRKNLFDREVPKYTQIGNAVPVRMAEAVGYHFAKILSERESKQ